MKFSAATSRDLLSELGRRRGLAWPDWRQYHFYSRPSTDTEAGLSLCPPPAEASWYRRDVVVAGGRQRRVSAVIVGGDNALPPPLPLITLWNANLLESPPNLNVGRVRRQVGAESDAERARGKEEAGQTRDAAGCPRQTEGLTDGRRRC